MKYKPFIHPIELENNPAEVELILGYKKYYDNTLGTQWRNWSKKELDENIIKYTKLAEKCNIPFFIHKIHEIVKEGKVSSLDKIIEIFNIEVPYEFQGEGYGTKALKEVEEQYGSKGKGYEYMICNAVTDSGKTFAKKMGFEQLVDTLYGKSLVE